jgi:hypothetical protein
MQLHNNGKIVCDIIQASRSSKTPPVAQFGSSTPLEVHDIFNLIVPKDSKVVPAMGAKFSIFANEMPEQPAQPIEIISSVLESPLGDLYEYVESPV